MRLVRVVTSETIDLTGVAPLGSGGEASVYRVPQGHTAGFWASLRSWLLPIVGSSDADSESSDTSPQKLVAKIYHPHRRTRERQAKLRHMLANPPHDPLLAHAQIPSIAWPIDLLIEPGTNVFVGYLMPLIEMSGPTGGYSILNFYNPLLRKRKGLLLPDLYLHVIASNLASLVAELHAKDYIIGDINQSNFLARLNTYTTVIDTDSFQVPIAGGQVFGTKMATPGFVAPELLHGSAGKYRTKEQDCFALGVLIFRLLMRGQHPYAASQSNALAGMTESDENQLVLAGLFPHGSRKSLGTKPPLGAPQFDALPPPLQGLFTACFVDGHKQPAQRPTAEEWRKQLNALVRLDHEATKKTRTPVLAADSQLRVCDRNNDHIVSLHLPKGYCPQCDRLQTELPIPPQFASWLPSPSLLPTENPESNARAIIEISWLHLSDLCFGRGLYSAWRSEIEEQFLSDIESQHSEFGPFDFLFLTGDLTYSGRPSQFDDLTKFLDKLQRRIKVNGRSPLLLAVPGEHDNVWLKERTSAQEIEQSTMVYVSELLQCFSESYSNLDEDLLRILDALFIIDGTSPHRRVIKDGFSNYETWWRSQTVPQQKFIYRAGSLPGDFSTKIEKGGVRIGIVGLNTAFSKFDDPQNSISATMLSELRKKKQIEFNLKDRYFLNRQQYDLLKNIDGSSPIDDVDIAFLLTHHPPSALLIHALAEFHHIAPLNRFSLHLCGHQYENIFRLTEPNEIDPRNLIQAAAFFMGQKEKERIHGYMIGKMKIDKKEQSAEVGIRPRKAYYSKGPRRWVFKPDNDHDLEREKFKWLPKLKLRQRQRRSTDG